MVVLGGGAVSHERGTTVFARHRGEADLSGSVQDLASRTSRLGRTKPTGLPRSYETACPPRTTTGP